MLKLIFYTQIAKFVIQQRKIFKKKSFKTQKCLKKIVVN